MSEQSELEAAIAALETQRAVLGDAVVNAALDPMRDKLAALLEVEAPAVPADDGERKFVTMIFADLSGSTALGEVMDPEEIRDLLNGCFDRLVPQVKQFGGTIDKFIGDNVMALFGAPVAHENDPERALRAALGMMEALAEFNADNGVELGIHVGINSGLVIAGGMGSEGERRYSVLGDAVNVAARLESASERGEILVGPDTRRLAGPLFEYVDLEPIFVKGRDESVAVSRLVGVRAGRESGRGIEGLSSPMVGRDEELERFRARLEGVAEGSGGVVGVVAEAGVGKSRFVVEARAVAYEGVEWAEGAALAHTGDVPYALAADLMRDLLDVAPDAPLDEVSGELAGKLAVRMSADAAGAEWPFLARLLDLPLGGDAEAVLAQYEGAPQVLEQRTDDAFRRLVESWASDPLVLVWEDLHWADESSLRLLERLIRVAGRLPLLLVLMFRPGDSPMSRLHERLTEDETRRYDVIELSPLSRAESESLVDGLLNIENLPAATKDLILTKAEGNPLFLEELLRSLIDAGMVVIEAQGAVATDAIDGLEAIDIPDTVHGVIGARIDQLPAGRKATLQSASVIGRVFQRRVLQYVAAAGVDDDLTELQRLDFITAENQTAQLTEFLFKHVFTQEAAYNGILLARRRALHAAAAEAIEALFPDRLDEHSATLARHYELAAKTQKAVIYLLKAAQRAAAAYANQDALDFANRGLGIVDSSDARTRAELLLVREAVLSVRGGGDPQDREDDVATLDSLAREIDDDALTLEVGYRRVRFDLASGHDGAALERAEGLMELARKLGDRRKTAQLLLGRGHALASMAQRHGDADNHALAVEDYERSLEISRSESLLDIQMFALNAVSMMQIRGRQGDARDLLRQVLDIAIQLGDRSRQSIARHNLGWHGLNAGEFDEARHHLEQGLELAASEDNTGSVVGQSAVLADLLFLQSDYQAALETARDAYAIVDTGKLLAAGESIWKPLLLREIGDYLMALGRFEEAGEALDESLRLREAAGERSTQMHSRAAIVRLRLEMGDSEDAAVMASAIADFLLDGGEVGGIEYAARVFESCLRGLETGDDRREPLLALAGEQLERDERAGFAGLPWHDELRRMLAKA